MLRNIITRGKPSSKLNAQCVGPTVKTYFTSHTFRNYCSRTINTTVIAVVESSQLLI